MKNILEKIAQATLIVVTVIAVYTVTYQVAYKVLTATLVLLSKMLGKSKMLAAKFIENINFRKEEMGQ